MSVVAIIPARGGSKGIRNKNIIDFCGKPLLAWSILQAKAARGIDSVWVSSDSNPILSVARDYGAYPIKRPPELSTDDASSESAWLHALDHIEKAGDAVEFMIGMQATSPLRETSDLERALAEVRREKLDSLLSCCEIEDFFMWKKGPEGTPESINYDYRNRKRRQAIEKRYLENGSFYIFTPEILRKTNNRLGGKIGLHVMERHQMFQIDNEPDLRLCAALFMAYGGAADARRSAR